MSTTNINPIYTDRYYINKKESALNLTIDLKNKFKGRIFATAIIPQIAYWLPFYNWPETMPRDRIYLEPMNVEDLKRNEKDGVTEGYEFIINYGSTEEARDEVRKYMARLSHDIKYSQFFESFTQVWRSDLNIQTIDIN